MSIQTETLGYPRIDKNREVKKALLANSSGKSEAERRWQTVDDVQLAKVLREEANATAK
jgi:5-methyltetrahydropteroyltriglutamate--homocysteine methyltransferase